MATAGETTWGWVSPGVSPACGRVELHKAYIQKRKSTFQAPCQTTTVQSLRLFFSCCQLRHRGNRVALPFFISLSRHREPWHALAMNSWAASRHFILAVYPGCLLEARGHPAPFDEKQLRPGVA